MVSRIGGRKFLLEGEEKGRLWSCISRAAAFSGVELLSWAIMDNHFHLLVRVLERQEVSDAELERRMSVLYGHAKFAAVKDKWASWIKHGNGVRVLDEKARLRNRMFDLSQFCKTFKEEYSQDYNRRHENTGTIWEGRFKSILVEGSARALSTVSSYIHLNPVRAGIAKRPEEAKWTSFGAACSGNESARTALCALSGRAFGAKFSDWASARAKLLSIMSGEMAGATASVSEWMAARAKDPVLARFFPAEDDETAKNLAAPVDFGALLMQRVVSFLHGGAIGGFAFLAMAARLLPQRRRRRSRLLLDDCRIPDLTPLAGSRGAS